MSRKEGNKGFIVFACKDSFIPDSVKMSHAVKEMPMVLPINIKSERDKQSIIKEMEAHDISEYLVFENDQEVQVISYVNTLLVNLPESTIVVKFEFTK
ncbi:hypothetical protein VB776_18310 [Arcicella sp. DC2W]|uniref:Uncharacterized protein n=1 Tax=Arcicella gelida TaxID=2984195 RepID=A0ABU5S907_9BACT|nr:hypothetical protein [Arcicella sp. DC2W]MEA5404895.1 hypothetical protein [Arcicella sp. DC2W]